MKSEYDILAGIEDKELRVRFFWMLSTIIGQEGDAIDAATSLKDYVNEMTQRLKAAEGNAEEAAKMWAGALSKACKNHKSEPVDLMEKARGEYCRVEYEKCAPTSEDLHKLRECVDLKKKAKGE